MTGGAGLQRYLMGSRVVTGTLATGGGLTYVSPMSHSLTCGMGFVCGWIVFLLKGFTKTLS